MTSIILLGLAFFLNVMAFSKKNLLLTMAASMSWLVLAMYCFFSATPPFGLTESWQQILVWIFAMLIFVPIVMHMNTEVRREVAGRLGERFLYTDYGSKPSTPTTNNQEAYRGMLRGKLKNRRTIRYKRRG